MVLDNAELTDKPQEGGSVHPNNQNHGLEGKFLHLSRTLSLYAKFREVQKDYAEFFINQWGPLVGVDSDLIRACYKVFSRNCEDASPQELVAFFNRTAYQP